MESKLFDKNRLGEDAMSSKKGRNELCSCGSGKKHKKCCGMQQQLQSQMRSELFKSGIGFQKDVLTKGLSERVIKVMKNANEGIGHKMHDIHTQNNAENPDESDASEGSDHHNCSGCCH
jgi:hypothetical protein